MGWSENPNIYIAEACLDWPQWEKIYLILRRLKAPGKWEWLIRE